MTRGAVVLILFTFIAAIIGFSGLVEDEAALISRLLFFVFLIFFLVALFFGRRLIR